jgi:hypothetical protein
MKQIGTIMITKFNNWKPAFLGFATLFVDNLTEINIVVQILVGLASATYISIRAYYLIKYKGKAK